MSISPNSSNSSKPQFLKTQFNYNGVDEKLFYKKMVKLLYDTDADDIIFKNGNHRDLSKSNVWVKCM